MPQLSCRVIHTKYQGTETLNLNFLHQQCYKVLLKTFVRCCNAVFQEICSFWHCDGNNHDITEQGKGTDGLLLLLGNWLKTLESGYAIM